jgi:hypothetical protein
MSKLRPMPNLGRFTVKLLRYNVNRIRIFLFCHMFIWLVPYFSKGLHACMQNVPKLRIPLFIEPVLWIGDPYADSNPTFHYDADPAEWCRSDRHFEKSFDLFEVCDGDTVKAHKLVLSACSPLFRWVPDTGDQYSSIYSVPYHDVLDVLLPVFFRIQLRIVSVGV